MTDDLIDQIHKKRYELMCNVATSHRDKPIITVYVNDDFWHELQRYMANRSSAPSAYVPLDLPTEFYGATVHRVVSPGHPTYSIFGSVTRCSSNS